MSLVENGGTGMTMPVVPMYGNGGNGNNDGIGDGWWIILLLLAMNGWGNNNGFGGGNGGVGAIWPYFTSQNTDSQVRAGFDTAALSGQLTAIQGGQADAEVAACGRAMDQMQATYNAQIAGMNQRFGDTLALTNQLNQINGSLQNCCCENRASVADLKYTVATEACADRAAVDTALRDVLTAMTASNQRILDQMCQDKIDAKNEKIAELQQQLYMKDLAASQLAQTGELRAGQQAAVDSLYTRLSNCPVPSMPVYGSQPIFTCPQNQGCGCGSF